MNIESVRQVAWQQWFVAIAAVGVSLIILVQGRFFLIPLAIAVLLFSLMSAALDRIARLRVGSVEMPDWLAGLIGLVAIIAAMLAMFRIIAGQIDAIIATGPAYVARGQQLVTSIFAWLGEDVSAGLVAAFEDIDLAAYIRAFAGSAGYSLATAILIVLYVGFLFAERARFPDKVANLFPDPDREAHVKRIFQSISQNVRRYVLIKTFVSVLTGVLAYVVMQSFGLEFAETWALLTVFLNFIPNIGSIVATVIPTLAALVQFENWTPVVLIVTIIGVIQFAVGNLIEPTPDGPLAQSQPLRHHPVADLLGGHLGHCRHVPRRSHHGDGVDHLLPCAQPAPGRRPAVARRSAHDGKGPGQRRPLTIRPAAARRWGLRPWRNWQTGR
jgi:AI-2 transport protein TqsA